jgi:UDP-N-acetylglucosamine 2-epimerase (non-hydrolysing)
VGDTDHFRRGGIALVLGTRPEIIKLSGIAQLLGPAARIVHTGQHYDHDLAGSFFEEYGMPAPDVVLGIGGISRGAQIGRVVAQLDRHFADHPPDAVIVQGDTNAALAGALAANAGALPLLHVEAGLRSHDRQMPEEHNRVLVDHLADLCCAPTEVSRANLAAEGISGPRVEVTGNTVVEAVGRLLPGREQRRALLDRMGLRAGRFVLGTFHRPENVDDPLCLERILRELAALPLPVVLPLHPRTAQRVRSHDLCPLLDGLRVLPPVRHADFLGLAAESAFMVSDSGGVQEEASVLKRPVLVVRASTERPEVLGTFSELVPPGPRIGEVATGWIAELEALHGRLDRTPGPYGDGSASRRSVAALQRLLRR